MKKSVLALALAFGVTTAFAQDLTSKKGEPILPEAGDWGLGIDATPILSFAKSFIGAGVGASTINWNFITSNQTISGRYFADEKTVYRGAIRLGFGSQTWKNNVTQDGSTSTPPATVVDQKSTSYNGIGLSGGIEMRKGKTRLQGYYGGEVGIWLAGTHDKYTYGNAFSTANNGNNPTTTDFNAPMSGGGFGTLGSGVGRTTDMKAGSTFAFGLRGFIGAEYFILPKMSIGGEFGWGLGFSSTGEGSMTTEDLNSTATGSQLNTTKVAGGSKFWLDTDNVNTVFGSSASIRWNMYF